MNIFEHPRQKFLTKMNALLAIQHLAYMLIMLFSIKFFSDAFEFPIITNVLIFFFAWIGVSYFTQVGALKLNLFGYIGYVLNIAFGGLFYAELTTYVDSKYICIFLATMILGFSLLAIVGVLTPFDIATKAITINTSIILALFATGYMYLIYPQIYIAGAIDIGLAIVFDILYLSYLPYVNQIEGLHYPEKADGFIINCTMVYALTPVKLILYLWRRFVNLFEYPDSPTRYRR